MIAVLAMLTALLTALLIMAPGSPRADAQVQCLASDEPELRQCIIDANLTASGLAGISTIFLTDNITLTANLLPVIDSTGIIAILGGGHVIDAGLFNAVTFQAAGGVVAIENLEILGGGGDALHAVSDVNLELNQVLIHHARFDGISARGAAVVTATNVTIKDSGDDGIEIQDSASATLTNATIADNRFALYDNSPGGSITLKASVIARHTANNHCPADVPIDGGLNVTDNSSCPGTLHGDLGTTLSPIVDTNGCQNCARSIALLPGSPAVDAAPNCGTFTDARYITRSTACDAGAFEAFDCDLTTPQNETQLSFAIGCYNTGTVDRIISLTRDIVLTEPLLNIRNLAIPTPFLNIEANGHTIDANGLGSAVLSMSAGRAFFERGTLQGSQNQGVYVSGGEIEIRSSTIRDNLQQGVWANGFDGDTNVVLRNSTVWNNDVGLLQTDPADLGGFAMTVANNTTGVASDSTTHTFINASLFARNGTDCVGPSTWTATSLHSDGSCDAAVDAGVNAALASGLADNNNGGGPATLALTSGSPAIDFYSTCPDFIVDQRGLSRTEFKCDAGAFELGDRDNDDDSFDGPLGDNRDCNDNNPAINPDATDIAGDGIDQDCSGSDATVDPDNDGDGFDGPLGDNQDCNDNNPAINPDATDIAGDGIDQDCSGSDATRGQCNGTTATIDMNLGESGTGTSGNDVILGTPGDDTIDAGDGDDLICAGSGDDNVVGGDGDDTIFGAAGSDVLRGGPGVDTISGGDDNDRLLGGIGGDTINGGNGNDYLGGFGGDDRLFGDLGNDRIFGGFGADTISGGPGNDNVNGLVGNDTINGEDGNDTLSGDRGNDTISGGNGNDTINGGNAGDVLRGDGGDDNLKGGRADDSLSGGAGTDVCTGNAHFVTDTADATCETTFGIP